MTATRAQALPKCLQLSEMLIREIAAGRLADGARLPPERVMAAEQGVAVGTLRKALSVLEEQGLLERVQGSGNYVRARGDMNSIYSFFRLELAEGGGFPTAEMLDVLLMSKPTDAPEFGASARAHRIRRLRLLDDLVVALEEIWLDERFASHLRMSDLSDSLYRHYKEQLGLVISRIEDRIGVDEVPEWGADHIGLQKASPAGFVERLGFSQDNEPAEYSRTWFHPVRARYTLRLQ